MNDYQPFSRGSQTSYEAAQSVDTSTGRYRVWEALFRAGPIGMTDDELEVTLDIFLDTVRPRRRGLVIDGIVEDSGKTRLTRRGRRAVVWIMKPEGLTNG